MVAVLLVSMSPIAEAVRCEKDKDCPKSEFLFITFFYAI
jgi:hypothetical protein